MRDMRRLFLVIGIIVVAMLISSTAFAGVTFPDVVFLDGDFQCDSADLQISPELDYVEVALRVIVDGVNTSLSTYPVTGAPMFVNVSFGMRITTMSYVQIDVSATEADGTSTAWQYLTAININCSTGEDPGDPQDPVTRPTDGRFCFAPGQARAAVYAVRDASGETGISIWAIDTKDKGEPVITLTAAQLREATSKSESVVLLSQSLLNNIKFYQLRDVNGKISYQINVGPVGELKVHECRFSSIPAPDAKVTSFEPGK